MARAGEGMRNRRADDGVAFLVGNARVGSRGEREAEAVEQEIRDHDRRDQRQDEQRLAVALESCRFLHEAPVERIADRGEHGDFDQILAQRERNAQRAGVGECLVIADDDQLQLSRQ